jgi:benzoyl-CoA reductase/2-hydroxyglutaryl-CoA dehydratase subunit BcrC/BadD/HgdB
MMMNEMAAKVRSRLAGLMGPVGYFLRHSLAGFAVESKRPLDILIYAKYWLLIWAMIFKFVGKFLFKKGPVRLIRVLINYPWIFTLLRATELQARMSHGRKGPYLESTGLIIYSIAVTLVQLMEEVLYDPEHLLINEDLVPPEIGKAMGLNVWLVEALGILLPFLRCDYAEKYIDEAENVGVNPDACSFVKNAMGMVIRGHMPKGSVIVSSNMPCEAGMASYSFIQREYNVPIYRLDAPANLYDERAEKLFVEDLKGMIAFLEKHTQGRMDWDRLREICKTRNRMLELELELWDMMRARPAPLAAEATYLSHLWHVYWFPDNPMGVRLFEKLVELARKNLDTKTPAVENEKYRAVLWNPPFPCFVDIFNILERKYGLTLIIDSMTYNRIPPIDTSTPETMLKGLAKNMLQGPMVRHTRGPVENYMDDIFRIYKQFDLDMVWVAAHLSCKSGQGAHGILREKCRQENIPLLLLDYDLLDTRIVSQDNMMRQMDHFMENVMKAQRIDH